MKEATIWLLALIVLLGFAPPQRKYRPPRWPQPKTLIVTQAKLPSLIEPLIAAHAIRWHDVDSPNAGRTWKIVVEIANISSQPMLKQIWFDVGWPGRVDRSANVRSLRKLERNEPQWVIIDVRLRESSGAAPPFPGVIVEVTRIE